MTGEYCKNNERGDVLRDNSHDLLRRINEEIEANRNYPQALWESLRCFLVVDVGSMHSGLLRDVLEFCLAVYDTVEPNAPFDEQQKRIAHAEALALSLNPRIGSVLADLSANDNSFLVKWSALTGACMLALRKQANTLKSDLFVFESFVSESRQVDHEELVMSVWLYSLYSAIFTLAHGRIPAGVLGIASFGLGFAISELGDMTSA